MISQNSIENLKHRLDIVDIIGSYLDLKKSGTSSYSCICPFHDDTNPSMSIHQGKQIYHCFSCGAGGDSIKFVMEYENLNYPEAIERLASMYNFTLEYTDTKENTEDKKILEKLASFYQDELFKNHEALNYLNKRGINKSLIDEFQIGFAPNSAQSMKFLRDMRIKQDEALKCGALELGNNGAYARFIQRITFPISLPNGKIVGFGGRSINNHPAKYINSSQSNIFNKSSILYGYDKAKNHIYKEQNIIVTEGYIDVIMLHKAGFKTAVATLGTALTTQHIPLLNKSMPKIILSYDGDLAGINAAFKASNMLSLMQKEGGVVIFKDNLDPADMVFNNQINTLKNMFQNYIPFIEFCIIQIVRKYNINNPLLKQKALNEVISYLQKLPKIIANAYIIFVSDILKIKPNMIKLANQSTNQTTLTTHKDTLELSLIKTLLEHKDYISFVKECLEPNMLLHENEYIFAISNQEEKLRHLFFQDEIKILSQDDVKQAIIFILRKFHTKKIQEIKKSNLSFDKKSFLIQKEFNILEKLKKGILVTK